MNLSRQTLPRLIRFVCCAALAAGAGPSLRASDLGVPGLQSRPATVPTSPVKVVIHPDRDGNVQTITVSHLNHTTTIPHRDWKRELDYRLRKLQNDLGTPVDIFVDADIIVTVDGGVIKRKGILVSPFGEASVNEVEDLVKGTGIRRVSRSGICQPFRWAGTQF